MDNTEGAESIGDISMMDRKMIEVIRELIESKPKPELFIEKIHENNDMIPALLEIMNDEKGTAKFYAEKALRLLSEKNPDILYPYFDEISEFIDNSNNFIKWGAIITISNLISADKEDKFSKIYSRYFSLLDSDSMITASNVAKNAWKFIIKNKSCEDDITGRLLGTENNIYKNKGEASPECKNIMLGHVLGCFEKYYEFSGNKEKIIEFAKRQTTNPRKAVAKRAEAFLKKLKKCN
jgi:hypothetical protein